MEGAMRGPSGLLPVQDKTARYATAAAEALGEAIDYVDQIVACFEENKEQSGEPLAAIWSKQQNCMRHVSDAPDGDWLIAIGFPHPSEFPTCIGASLEAALRHVGEHYPRTVGGDPSRWNRADLKRAYADTYAAEAVCTALYKICRADHVLAGPLGRASSSLSAMHVQLSAADYDDQLMQFQLDLAALQGDISVRMERQSGAMTVMTVVILVCTIVQVAVALASCAAPKLTVSMDVGSLAERAD